jgi:hypothetical protein
MASLSKSMVRISYSARISIASVSAGGVQLFDSQVLAHVKDAACPDGFI